MQFKHTFGRFRDTNQNSTMQHISTSHFCVRNSHNQRHLTIIIDNSLIYTFLATLLIFYLLTRRELVTLFDRWYSCFKDILYINGPTHNDAHICIHMHIYIIYQLDWTASRALMTTLYGTKRGVEEGGTQSNESK